MSIKLITCCKCLGAKTIMEPNSTKGFSYPVCSLCKGKGEIHPELHDDFIFSQNEENFDDDYEFNDQY